jgi:hypothetical protein
MCVCTIYIAPITEWYTIVLSSPMVYLLLYHNILERTLQRSHLPCQVLPLPGVQVQPPQVVQVLPPAAQATMHPQAITQHHCCMAAATAGPRGGPCTVISSSNNSSWR